MRRCALLILLLYACPAEDDADDGLPAKDIGPADTGVAPDTGTTDTGVEPDTGMVADTGTPDTGTPDSGTPDTGTPDTGAPDTGAPDTGTPDTGTPDTGGNAPPGPDTTMPFPIDRGDDGANTPGTYKGLWLRLVDNGAPSVTPVDGVIGLVCVGMSNSSQECGHFIQQASGPLAAQISGEVVIVNCAVGGHAIERWNDPADDGTLWDACVDTKIPAAGIRPDQVRVVYHKAANQFTTGQGGQPLPLYPAAGSDYENFVANLTTFAGRLAQELPSVQAVYTTSRMYGGYSGNPGRGEPLSYEEGHALNTWLAANPSVGAVWYGWGPYIWAPACGSGETNASGVCYDQSDLQNDGVHPATGARQKITTMIHARFSEHAWYQP